MERLKRAVGDAGVRSRLPFPVTQCFVLPLLLHTQLFPPCDMKVIALQMALTFAEHKQNNSSDST